jgi:hypothetical protein
VQILQRERNPTEDHNTKAPLQNVVIEEYDEDECPEDQEDHIHCVKEELEKSFLTQNDYEEALTNEKINELSDDNGVFQEDDKNRYNLISKATSTKQSTTTPPQKKNLVPVKQHNQDQQNLKELQIALKAPSHEIKTSDKTSLSFNLKEKKKKIKIPIPLVELMKNESFKKKKMSTLYPRCTSESANILNIQYNQPTIVLGPIIEDRDEICPPFYISLNIHDKILHNFLLDSGASHNLMLKVVMEELGIEITKTYHDLFSFDSKRFKFFGLIKYLVVTLTSTSMKTMVMDVVVTDIPPKFGCLLSISFMKRLGGTLQMDLSYATIPVFGGENKRLYRESQLAYIISDDQNPVNHPIYSVDIGMGSCILQINDTLSDSLLLKKPIV